MCGASCQDPDSLRTFPLSSFLRERFSHWEDVWVRLWPAEQLNKDESPAPAELVGSSAAHLRCVLHGFLVAWVGGRLASDHLNVRIKIVDFVQSAAHLVCFPHGWREFVCTWRCHLRVPLRIETLRIKSEMEAPQALCTWLDFLLQSWRERLDSCDIYKKTWCVMPKGMVSCVCMCVCLCVLWFHQASRATHVSF